MYEYVIEEEFEYVLEPTRQWQPIVEEPQFGPVEIPFWELKMQEDLEV